MEGVAAVTAAMYLAVASQVKAVGEVGVSWLGGGVRKRMVMESEGWWLSMSLPSSTIETRCPLPKAEYRTMESFMVMMIQEKVFFFLFAFSLSLSVLILRRVICVWRESVFLALFIGSVGR